MAGEDRQDSRRGRMSNTRVVDGPGFRIRLDDEPGYLRACICDGVDSYEVSLAAWRILAAECQAARPARMLVLEDLESTINAEEIERLEVEIHRMLPAMRVAFVELRDDVQGAELGEIIARGRGINTRAFSSETEARRWLLFGD
ncbi:MAG: hypothetical protein QM769_10200 [Pseudoxanthomonas sp.]